MAYNPYQYPPAYATQPLQAPYDFGPTGFYGLAQYVTGQPAASAGSTTYRVAPIVATYPTTTHRTQAINGALPQDQQQYQAGAVVGAATRYYPTGTGGIGIVVSPLQGATQSSAEGANSWHAVGVLRQGQTVWIHDPAYQTGSQQRLPMIPGTSNVTRLLNSKGFGAVNLVQVQGFGSAEPDCMGRSAQWVDNVTNVPAAVAPYPPGSFVPGQPTPGWQVVARY
jgi:hypothetical protein